MNGTTSFSKLRDGNWGIRVATKGRHPDPGTEVVVRKADGKSSRVLLGAIVDRDRGAFPAPAYYYKIARPEASQRGSR